MTLSMEMALRQTEPVIELTPPVRMYTAQCRTCHADVVTSFRFRDLALERMANHALCHERDVTPLASSAGDVLKHYDVREIEQLGCLPQGTARE